MYDLNKMMKECISECAALAIPFDGNICPYVRVNNRLKSSWARCIRKNGYYRFHIEFSPKTLESEDLMAVKSTMMHEVLHCAKDSFKHTGAWKQYADIVNRKYGYNVKRTDSYEEMGLVQPERKIPVYKYEQYCPSCGKAWKYKSKCDAIKRPWRYICIDCHEHLESRTI